MRGRGWGDSVLVSSMVQSELIYYKKQQCLELEEFQVIVRIRVQIR